MYSTHVVNAIAYILSNDHQNIWRTMNQMSKPLAFSLHLLLAGSRHLRCVTLTVPANLVMLPASETWLNPVPATFSWIATYSLQPTVFIKAGWAEDMSYCTVMWSHIIFIIYRVGFWGGNTIGWVCTLPRACMRYFPHTDLTLLQDICTAPVYFQFTTVINPNTRAHFMPMY